jgi:hypothetical protein
VVGRGETVGDDGKLQADRGGSVFQPCYPPEPARSLGRLSAERDPVRNFGADLIGSGRGRKIGKPPAV